MSSSAVKVFAIFRRTSGAILGTLSQYSPISHRMLARAIGTCRFEQQIKENFEFTSMLNKYKWIHSSNNTMMDHTVMLSKSLAMCLMISLCWVGWVWSSFLITTTLSATTVSAKQEHENSTVIHKEGKRCGSKVSVVSEFYHLCWKAAAPDRSDTCRSPQRCWWHTCRWPEWWQRRTPCPGFSHRSEKRHNKDVNRGNCHREGFVSITGNDEEANLKFPQNSGDVGFIGQVGQNLQLQEIKGDHKVGWRVSSVKVQMSFERLKWLCSVSPWGSIDWSTWCIVVDLSLIYSFGTVQ